MDASKCMDNNFERQFLKPNIFIFFKVLHLTHFRSSDCTNLERQPRHSICSKGSRLGSPARTHHHKGHWGLFHLHAHIVPRPTGWPGICRECWFPETVPNASPETEYGNTQPSRADSFPRQTGHEVNCHVFNCKPISMQAVNGYIEN